LSVYNSSERNKAELPRSDIVNVNDFDQECEGAVFEKEQIYP